VPRKVFVAGEILTAADVNTNLMDQAVMVFDDAAARTTAIPSPVEGMVTYLKDTDALEKYTDAWRSVTSRADMPAGTILQVVSTTKTDTFSSASTSPADITGATVTITPTSSTNKVLVFFSFPVASSTGDFVATQLVRGSTVIGGGDVAGNRRSAISRGFNDGADFALQFNGSFLDSPATTSATTYKLTVFSNSGTAYVGRNSSNTDDNSARQVRSGLTITAMEVAA